MPDSNYTLRWNRTARQAYGHDVDFHGSESEYTDFDRFVFFVMVFALGFILGVLVS